jgi:hypothetical protein
MKSKQTVLVASFLMILCGAFAPCLARAQAKIKPAKVKMDTFKGEVIRMNTVSIIVRDPKDSYIVRTFTFSPDLTKKLQSLIGRGGYQPGDTVTVRYQDGTSVADVIKGKPSKAY